jgi:hypothetical protein
MILIFCYTALLNFNFYVLLCGNNETKDCSLIRGLLCTCTSIQRRKTDVYMLTLRSFRNYAKISNDFNF